MIVALAIAAPEQVGASYPPPWARSPSREAATGDRVRNRGGRPTQCSSPILPSSPRSRRTGGQTTQTDSCSQHTRAGRRGGHRKLGLKAHRAKNGLPSLRSPKSLSRSTETTAEPGQQPSKRPFHGPKVSSASFVLRPLGTATQIRPTQQRLMRSSRCTGTRAHADAWWAVGAVLPQGRQSLFAWARHTCARARQQNA
jgi:hypothetical protein